MGGKRLLLTSTLLIRTCIEIKLENYISSYIISVDILCEKYNFI